MLLYTLVSVTHLSCTGLNRPLADRVKVGLIHPEL